jgi:hypothetical protein
MTGDTTPVQTLAEVLVLRRPPRLDGPYDDEHAEPTGAWRSHSRRR